MDDIADHEFKIILLGASGVGKTSLTHTYVEGRFNRNRNVTIITDRSDKELTVRGRRVKLCIWDTAGQERFKSFVTGYFRDVDGVLLVYDVTNVMTFNELSSWLTKVREQSPGAVPFVVGNKIDHPDRNAVSQDVVKRFARDENLEFMESSAKEGDNVNQIFERLTLRILQTKGIVSDEDATSTKIKTITSASDMSSVKFVDPMPKRLDDESPRHLLMEPESSTSINVSNTQNSTLDTTTRKTNQAVLNRISPATADCCVITNQNSPKVPPETADCCVSTNQNIPALPPETAYCCVSTNQNIPALPPETAYCCVSTNRNIPELPPAPVDCCVSTNRNIPELPPATVDCCVRRNQSIPEVPPATDSDDEFINSFVFVCYDRNLPPIVPLTGDVPQLQVGKRRNSADSVRSLVLKSKQNIKLHATAARSPKKKSMC